MMNGRKLTLIFIICIQKHWDVKTEKKKERWNVKKREREREREKEMVFELKEFARKEAKGKGN